jgi:general secretion pathway protein D
MKTLRLAIYCSPVVLLSLLTGCQTAMRPLPGPVDFPRSPKAQAMVTGAEQPRATSTQISPLPGAPAAKTAMPPAPPPPLDPAADAELVSIAIEQTPLPVFVQILYGNLLRRPYTIDPAVLTRTDPVTFKSSQPLSKARVYQLAEALLSNYGLAVQDFDGLIRVAPAGAASTSVPVISRGSSESAVASLRPVYHYLELDVVRTADMSQWLKQMLGTRVNLQEDANRNAFLLSGTQADVKAAIELIQSLDQPRMRGRVARRITPAHASATDFASRLSEMLTAQGYSVALSSATGTAPILIIPVGSIGSVVVFTNSNSTMEHVLRWVQELDRPSIGGTANGLFTYPVRYADAQELARTLGELLGGGGSSPAPAPVSGGVAGGVAAAPAPRPSYGGRVVVNNATNTLIFRGSSAEEQQQITRLLRELDRPTKSAMIEVVVAELAVGALERLGVQWTSSNLGTIGNGRRVTAGGSGISISYANSAREILSVIDALATDSQARVLSNPKVLARNGETATIQVGKEVPIVTSQQSTTTGSLFPIGNQGVLQQIQYRSTGVILKVRPIINSGNRLDLDIAQEVSSAASTETGVTSTPTISTRKIETKLSLRDGSTVLLGGLISRDENTSDSGVPLLKDIPGLGALFRNKSGQSTQTELLVMITPYVVNDDFEAEELTSAIHQTFGSWARDIKTSRIVPTPESAAIRDSDSAGNLIPAPRETTLAPTRNDVAPSATQVTPPIAPAIAPSTPSEIAPAPGLAPPVPGSGDAQMSRPQAAPAVPAAPTKAPAAAKPPAGSAVSPPAASAPADGKVVTDKKLLEEFERALKGKR